MCSHSVISQVALLQIHCAGTGGISGHVCVDQTYIPIPLDPRPAPAPLRPGLPQLHHAAQPGSRWDSTTFARFCGSTHLCLHQAADGGCPGLRSLPLCSALVMARNVPLIMHLWNSAVWEPSNYPAVAFLLRCHHNSGFIKSPTRAGVVCCRLYIYFFI